MKHAKGDENSVLEHHQTAVDVKTIRGKTGMSQQRFCATFGISLGTLRHWEQGLRTPRGTARILLKVIEKNPSVVMEVVAK